MQRIDKKLELATAYKAWLDKLDQSGAQHPAYNARHEFYNDVRANLLWVQAGLCAYTETLLISSDRVRPELWKDGRFVGETNKRLNPFGQLDHYDHELKIIRGWDWDNLFFIHSDINNRKGTKKAQILKPDRVDYRPDQYLDYDPTNHLFLANPTLTRESRNAVELDIDILGLNFDAIVDHRIEYLSKLFAYLEYGGYTIEQCRALLNKFPTAFEMGATKINA